MSVSPADVFPELTPAQIERLAARGRRTSTAAGDVLFAEGQSEYDMHVVLSGSVGVYDDVDGERTLLVGGVGARQLLGETGVLMGESTYATAVVDEPGEVVPELSEVVLRAFAARRASIFLVSHATRVLLCLRGDDLREGMSDYLARRIEAHPAIELRTGTEVTALAGDGVLDHVTLTRDGREERLACRAVFSFIGAAPCTGWLEGVGLDGRGFVLTGPDTTGALADRTGAGAGPDGADRSPLDEPDLQPARLTFETSLPGVFAVGDIRSGSTERVAGALAEGSVCVAEVHRYLQG